MTSLPVRAAAGAVAILTALGALSGCAGEPAPVETVYVTSGGEDPSPAAPAEEDEAPTADATQDTAPEAETFTMPSLVGVNLQLAQDTLQALGSYLMDQEDASGLGRMQINDSNWVVCTQDPAPGEVVEVATVVTLASVKLAETCP